MFRRILLAGVVAGAAAGLALTALQSTAVAPLLLAAETYEVGNGDAGAVPHRHGELTHSHASGHLEHEHDGHALVSASDETSSATRRFENQPAAVGRGDDHAHHPRGDAWGPEDGAERTFWTAVSNVATAIGFGLLLAAFFAWRGSATWRQGLLWGAAGFFVFFVNPAIGLHPEIPGALSADLLDRQLWWLLTVACSAAGVGPHLAGAPHPEVSGGLAPASLADSFVVAAAATNAAFWLVLGLVGAAAFSRLSRG